MRRVDAMLPSSRHSERFRLTSPWKIRRLSSLLSRLWSLARHQWWALTTRLLFPRHLRLSSGRRGASLASTAMSSRVSRSPGRRWTTIRIRRGSPPIRPSPRPVLLPHLLRDQLARGRQSLLITDVVMLVWPVVDIRVYLLQGSQAIQESSGMSSRTRNFKLLLARLPRP
jgi:hypothetical protein